MARSVQIPILIATLLAGSCTETRRDAVVSGPYLGQAPPGRHAQLFAPGIVSTGLGELNAAFTPTGDEIYWSISLGSLRWQLVSSQLAAGVWTKPYTVPFAGIWGGVDIVVSPDGGRIFFCSNRPRPGSTRASADFDIWYVERTESGWSVPMNPGPPVNSDAHEFYPSLASDGTLVFTSNRSHGYGGADVYLSRLVDGEYTQVELLPEPVNSPGNEGDTMIAPDGSYLVVTTRRDDVPPSHGSDLYVTFRTAEGWSPLRNLGGDVNSDGSENCPILSPDGRFLFFTSTRLRPELADALYDVATHRALWDEPGNGLQDLYWVDATVIAAARREAKEPTP